MNKEATGENRLPPRSHELKVEFTGPFFVSFPASCEGWNGGDSFGYPSQVSTPPTKPSMYLHCTFTGRTTLPDTGALP